MTEEQNKKQLEAKAVTEVPGLKRYVEDFAEILLDELVVSGLIKPVSDPGNGIKKFQLTGSRTKEEIITPTKTTKAPLKTERIIQDFYDFRNIALNVYNKIQTESPKDAGVNSLSKIVNWFRDQGVFEPAWNNVSILRDFIDKADNILQDEEIKKGSVQLLENHKVNFNQLSQQILEFFTRQQFRSFFTVESDWQNHENNKETVDLIMTATDLRATLLIEVKFRKKSVSTRELVQQGQEILKKYQDRSGYGKTAVLVVYTYENLDEIERSKFKFKQNLHGMLGENNNLIHFFPIQTASFSNLDEELQLLQTLSIERQSVFDFNFSNKVPNKAFPLIDDDYLPEIFNLQRNVYEIQFTETLGANYWRFGLKFSMEGHFPSKENRHLPSYPVFHLEKNFPSADRIQYAFYGTERSELGQFTKLSSDNWDKISLRVFLHNGKTLIDCIGPDNLSILPHRIEVNGFRYFQVFAWADGRNPFIFKAKIFVNKI